MRETKLHFLLGVMVALTVAWNGTAYSAAPCTAPAGYTAINSVADLQLVRDAIANQIVTNFFLCSDLVLQGEFVPLGDNLELDIGLPYYGEFEGNYHTVYNLSVHLQPGSQLGGGGFFANLSTLSQVRNLNFKNVTIAHRSSGALAGWSAGFISNVHVYGPGTIEGDFGVGGLIGEAYVSGYFGNPQRIENSSVDSQLTVIGNGEVGGLVGDSQLTITGSRADATVIGMLSELGYSNGVGGLVGTISPAYPATVMPSVERCSSKGKVSGYSIVGGLIGESQNTNVSESYAGGDVTGTEFVGGFIGWAYGSDVEGITPFIIRDSYASGAILHGEPGQSGYYAFGSLLGYLSYDSENPKNRAMLRNSYASGKLDSVLQPSRDNCIRGLVGCVDRSNVQAAYFNLTANPGYPSDERGIGKTSIELMHQATFEGWDISQTGGSATWLITEGSGFPYLRWRGQ